MQEPVLRLHVSHRIVHVREVLDLLEGVTELLLRAHRLLVQDVEESE